MHPREGPVPHATVDHRHRQPPTPSLPEHPRPIVSFHENQGSGLKAAEEAADRKTQIEGQVGHHRSLVESLLGLGLARGRHGGDQHGDVLGESTDQRGGHRHLADGHRVDPQAVPHHAALVPPQASAQRRDVVRSTAQEQHRSREEQQNEDEEVVEEPHDGVEGSEVRREYNGSGLRYKEALDVFGPWSVDLTT